MKSKNEGVHVMGALDTIHEAISLLQCAEDASTEEHVSLTVGIAVSMLLGAYDDLSSNDMTRSVHGGAE